MKDRWDFKRGQRKKVHFCRKTPTSYQRVQIHGTCLGQAAPCGDWKLVWNSGFGHPGKPGRFLTWSTAFWKYLATSPFANKGHLGMTTDSMSRTRWVLKHTEVWLEPLLLESGEGETDKPKGANGLTLTFLGKQKCSVLLSYLPCFPITLYQIQNPQLMCPSNLAVPELKAKIL